MSSKIFDNFLHKIIAGDYLPNAAANPIILVGQCLASKNENEKKEIPTFSRMPTFEEMYGKTGAKRWLLSRFISESCSQQSDPTESDIENLLKLPEIQKLVDYAESVRVFFQKKLDELIENKNKTTDERAVEIEGLLELFRNWRKITREFDPAKHTEWETYLKQKEELETRQFPNQYI